MDGTVNTAYSAGTASPETSDQEGTHDHEEEGPGPWEGTNVREYMYIKSLEDRIKKLEAGYLNVRQELLDERNHADHAERPP